MSSYVLNLTTNNIVIITNYTKETAYLNWDSLEYLINGSISRTQQDKVTGFSHNKPRVGRGVVMIDSPGIGDIVVLVAISTEIRRKDHVDE